MTQYRTMGCALGVLAVVASAARAVDYDIQPVGPQDGTIWNNVGTDNLGGPWGLWGFVNGNYYSNAGIHTLPSIPAASVALAQLIIPANHGLWTANGAIVMNQIWLVDHFEAIDDATLTGGLTGDFQQPSLGTLGIYATPPWPGQDNNRVVTLDVTNAVKADLTANRGSHAWRIIPTIGSTPGFNDNAQLFFPLSEMPPANGFPHNGARLQITLVPEPAAGCLMLIGLSLTVLRRHRPGGILNN
jgi:hypothetical protein